VIRLPFAAPPEAYALTLRLFDAATGRTYPVHSPTAAPEAALGTWTPARGATWSDAGSAVFALGADPESTRGVPAPALREPIKYGRELVLFAQSLAPDTGTPVRAGDRVSLTLLWSGDGRLPALELVGERNRWRTRVPPSSPTHDDYARDWRMIAVPANATSGTASLQVSGGPVLARLSVTELPRLDAPPDYDTPVGSEWPDVGTLVGVSSHAVPGDSDLLVPVTLVWRVGPERLTRDYVVFMHLLGPDGRLVAQSDSLPAGGDRPTFTWRPGEHIVDRHVMRWPGPPPDGGLRAVVGLYDPATGARLVLADGRDAVVLALDLSAP
jgi:hypothetical protein